MDRSNFTETAKNWINDGQPIGWQAAAQVPEHGHTWGAGDRENE
ncbi:hypothetical protein ACTMN8_002442 [Escherichia coli]|nr:hypothetical protein [Escherichia coli]